MIKIKLDDLNITNNAVFYKLKKSLTKKQIKEVFKDLCEAKKGKNKNVIAVRDNTRQKDVYISALVFSVEKNPVFIPEINIKEIKYSYLLLVEMNDTLVVSSLNIPNVFHKFPGKLMGYPYENISNTFAEHNPQFEKLRTQSADIINVGHHKKTIEGYELNTYDVGLNSIALALSVRTENQDLNSITLNTSRIRTNSGRIHIDNFLFWSKKIIIGINSSKKDSFLNVFAKQVEIEQILEGKLKPIGILLNLHVLEHIISESTDDNIGLFIKSADGNFTEMPLSNRKKLFSQFRKSLVIDYDSKSKGYKVHTEDYSILISILIDKLRISIPELKKCYLYSIENGPIRSLESFINKEQNFTVVFDHIEYIYTLKQLFLKQDITQNMDYFYDIMFTEDKLLDCTGEKYIQGSSIQQSDTKFQENTLLNVVENNIWDKNGHLICDDLGDEWADHISFRNSKDKDIAPEINFYISKHGDDTTGASKFHDVIGQALKNIGNIKGSNELFKLKIDGWKKSNYAKTNITKLRSDGNWNIVEKDVKEIIDNVLTVRSIYLVVSFLSKQRFIEEVKQFNSGTKKLKHIPQLIWFMLSFINSAKDNKIQPYIICKP
ncbi:MAG: hypothetical protein DRG78_04050 [Epsilonproteobacteria bacterium]|nr:MAG: hypothetical protein DRG78_04050 [Campylobacterota bacterium]